MTSEKRGKAVQGGLVPRLRFPQYRSAPSWACSSFGALLRLEYGTPLPSQDRRGGSVPVVGSNGVVGYHDMATVTGPTIVVGRKGSVGSLTWVSTDCCPIDTAFFVRIPRRGLVDLRFLFLALKHARLERLTDGGAVPGLNRNEVYAMPVALPELAEQQKTADCLNSLDERIAAETRQLDTLKTHKQGLLQQLFPRENGTALHLRFPAYRQAEPWHRYKGGKLFSNRNEKGTQGVPIYSVTMVDGMVPRDSLDRRIDDIGDASKNKAAMVGDVVYNMMRMWQGACGVAPENCMVSPAYVVLAPTSLAVAAFFGFMLKTPQEIRKLKAHSRGLTSDRLRLYFDDFAAIEFVVPKTPEQQKIADCLTSLDGLIAAQATKVDLLEQYKRGLMQQLFPVLDEVVA